MGNIWRNIYKNAATRLLMLVFGILMLISAVVVIYTYYSQIDLYEEKELAKLSGIATTMAIQIDGSAHEVLFDRYTSRDEIKTNDQSVLYHEIWKILKETQKANEIETSIYTLVYKPEKDIFNYGVNSGDNPFYRHEYVQYPQVLLDKYDEGGTIPVYETENGVWLSAFAPIKNLRGNTVALVQVDERFEKFIAQAREVVFKELIVIIIIILLIGVFLFFAMRNILQKEEDMKNQMKEYNNVIEQKNKDITDSIIYAEKIQEAMLPQLNVIKEKIPESFILFLPRDIVSGDFYWHTEIKGKQVIAAVDCTGHGVPGAFMSMIGSTLLNEVVNLKEVDDPGKILDELDEGVVEALSQHEDSSTSKDGMDMGILVIDRHAKKLSYAGANRPLIHLRDGKVNEIKGDKFPIAGGIPCEHDFTTHTISYREGDQFYVYSDGYPDQFGGPKNKKLMTKRLKRKLVEINDLSPDKQHSELLGYFKNWKEGYEQVDDVLVIGVRV